MSAPHRVRPPAATRGQPARRPLGSTYRLQLHGLGFDGARRLVGYLHDLGIETLYVSPVAAAVAGTTHGYDVVDPGRVDPALGGPAGLEALLGELDRHGMRLLVDVVPNHMAASWQNGWWWDVLRRGPASPVAAVFDVDWSRHGGRVLLPVLGAPLAECLAAGDLSLVEEDGEARVAYREQRFPLAPGTVPPAPGPAELAAVLGAQHYRLAYWRTGRHQGNYRRFFDIDSLVGVRVEDPAVFEATHALALELVADRRVAGLRVDHVDGLADPGGYLRHLRREVDAVAPAPPALVVEKILRRDERLPADWPVDGTTGYELGDLAGGLLVDPVGAARLAAGAAALTGAVDTGTPGGFASVAVEAKREVLATLFPGQLARLCERAAAAVEDDVPGSDLAVADLSAAVAELTSRLGVYRTYGDRRRLAQASDAALGALDAEGRRALRAFGALVADPGHGALSARWQQLSGAVAAKGVEDTALHRVDGLLAAAEVGGDPGAPAVGPDRFHRAMAERARRQPGGLSAASTHDSQRSGDVRCRLAVLSEMPERWTGQVGRWWRRHRALVARLGGPDAHDELLVYQSAVGVWPLGPHGSRDRDALAARLGAYAVKTARQAARRTGWLEPDAGYEDALVGFVRTLVGGRPGPGERFGRDVARLVSQIGAAGAAGSLALLALQATVPGVPDLYQGSEVWDLSLVDPDNRHPVDFAHRAALLGSLAGAPGAPGIPGRSGAPSPTPEQLLAAWPDGRLKLEVARRLLADRRARPVLFERGSYQGLAVTGRRRSHVVAFARHHRRQWAVTVVPRLVLGLAGAGRMPAGPGLWEGTSVVLPVGAPGQLHDVLTGDVVAAPGGRLPVRHVLARLPVAVLSDPGSQVRP